MNDGDVHAVSVGTILSDRLSIDGSIFYGLTFADSLVLDSYFPMHVESVKTIGNRTCLIEKIHSNQSPKLLSLLMAHLAFMGDSIENVDSKLSLYFVQQFMQKLSIKYSYSVPSVHTSMSSKLFDTAFKGTSPV